MKIVFFQLSTIHPTNVLAMSPGFSPGWYILYHEGMLQHPYELSLIYLHVLHYIIQHSQNPTLCLSTGSQFIINWIIQLLWVVPVFPYQAQDISSKAMLKFDGCYCSGCWRGSVDRSWGRSKNCLVRQLLHLRLLVWSTSKGGETLMSVWATFAGLRGCRCSR